VECIETFIPEDTLVTRPDQQVIVRRLPPGGRRVFDAIADGPVVRRCRRSRTRDLA